MNITDQMQELVEQYRQEGGDMAALHSAYQSATATDKTSLGLNQWVLTDKPRMAEFNEDNRIIDAKLREHDEAMRELAVEVVFPELLDGAKGYSSVIYQPKYAKSGRMITITGIVTQWTTGNALFTLPPRFWPVGNLLSTTLVSNSSRQKTADAFVTVSSSGNVVVDYGTPSHIENDRRWLHLNITYVAAA